MTSSNVPDCRDCGTAGDARAGRQPGRDRPAVDEEDVHPPVTVVVEEQTRPTPSSRRDVSRRLRRWCGETATPAWRAMSMNCGRGGSAPDTSATAKAATATEQMRHGATMVLGSPAALIRTVRQAASACRSSRSTSLAKSRRPCSSASRRTRSKRSSCRAASAVWPSRVCAVARAYLRFVVGRASVPARG